MRRREAQALEGGEQFLLGDRHLTRFELLRGVFLVFLRKTLETVIDMEFAFWRIGVQNSANNRGGLPPVTAQFDDIPWNTVDQRLTHEMVQVHALFHVGHSIFGRWTQLHPDAEPTQQGIKPGDAFRNAQPSPVIKVIQNIKIVHLAPFHNVSTLVQNAGVVWCNDKPRRDARAALS